MSDSTADAGSTADVAGAAERDIPETSGDTPADSKHTETADQDQTATEDTGATAEWGLGNWILLSFFLLLTVSAVVVSTAGSDGLMTAPSESTDTLVVPTFVYIYATLGALGYVFTKLIKDFESHDEPSEVSRLVEMFMRIPAAWVLGAGLYIAVVQFGSSPAEQSELLATTAFLAGLFVNVAIKSLGLLADRILGRVSGETPG